MVHIELTEGKGWDLFSFFSLLLNIKTCLFFLSLFKKIFRVVLCLLLWACFLLLFCVEIKLFYFITNVCASFTVITCRIFCIANIHFQSLPVKRKRKNERDLFGTNRCTLHYCESEIDVVCKTIRKQSRENSGRNRTPPSGGRWNKATQNWTVWRCIKC